ncbi:transporter [Glutamicibacter uratoxydans]|uniref:Transporter n=1 Tax=Glutamicibacter uratoxydans TaxID=43667 RepID=A0A4Y4DJK5_GLUUR|nr:SLC13 family permease [Glutamicibacter uratoxydans]GED05462.1 transporter [Glutamicibacter uratoxydans]
MTEVYYRTTPASAPAPQQPGRQSKRRLGWLLPAALACASGLLAFAPGGPGTAGALTLGIFAIAIWAWTSTKLPDTYVALCACLALVAVGALDTQQLFSALADDTIWLLLGAFLLAGGISASGLADYLGFKVISRARTVRQLFYLVTFALCATAFAIPATSGRAALALPIFTVLAGIFASQRAVVVGLSLLIPSVVLLSAVATLIGAGAHLITNQLLAAAGLEPISFLYWIVLGTPLALVSALAACEMILRMQVPREQRGSLDAETRSQLEVQRDNTLSPAMLRALVVLLVVISGWASSPATGIDPVLIALVGAAVMNFPGFTGAGIGASIKKTPLNILLFLAFTLALGTALNNTGAAGWLASVIFAPLGWLGAGGSLATVVVLTVLSLAAHLVIQSRSARSAVLIPLIIPLAMSQGLNPVASAFLSTAAAGFCHTLTSSAKPVALFSDIPDSPSFSPAELRSFATRFAPVMFALLMLFSWLIWPALGLNILSPTP